jgi:hypothetical protein
MDQEVCAREAWATILEADRMTRSSEIRAAQVKSNTPPLYSSGKEKLKQMWPVVGINARAVVRNAHCVAYYIEADLPAFDLLNPIHRVVDQVDENRVDSMTEICDLQFPECRRNAEVDGLRCKDGFKETSQIAAQGFSCYQILELRSGQTKWSEKAQSIHESLLGSES